MNTLKAASWATHLDQVRTLRPHLQMCDSRRLSHVTGYAPNRLGFGKDWLFYQGAHPSLLE